MASPSVEKSGDDATFERKFTNAKNTQESIQSIATWAMHHKNQHSKVVQMWLEVLKKSKAPRRLTLFYICNEIVQTCKRKRATSFKDSFQQVLLEAVALVRDASVKNNVERILTIWQERGVFESEFVDEMMAVLTRSDNSSKNRTANKTETKAERSAESSTAAVAALAASSILEEFKPNHVRELIAHMTQSEKDLELKRRRLNVHSIDELSLKLSKNVKDRSHSKLYTQQVEDIHKNLADYVSSVEVEREDRNRLIELLEQSEIFYDVQYGEAKIVTNAYKNFGTRISNLRKRLEDVKKTLPDPLSPIPSPSIDAPSPCDSPIDISLDNTEAVDMELSDDHDDDAYTPEADLLLSSDDVKALETKQVPTSQGITSVSNALAVTVPPNTISASSSSISSPVTVVGCTLSEQSTRTLLESDLAKSSDIVLSLLSSLRSQPLLASVLSATPDDPSCVKPPVTQLDSNEGTFHEADKQESFTAPVHKASQMLAVASVSAADRHDFVSQEDLFPDPFHASPSSPPSGEQVVVQLEKVDHSREMSKREPAYNTSRLIGEQVAVSLEKVYPSNDVFKAETNTSAYSTSHLVEDIQRQDNVLKSVANDWHRNESELLKQESAMSPTFMDADDDAGGLTPVLDEKPEMAEIPMSPPAPVFSMASFMSAAQPTMTTAASDQMPSASRVVDPIAFLNQMLSQSKPKESGSSSNFLQSLSLLSKGGLPGSQHSTSDNYVDNDEDAVFVGGYIDRRDVQHMMTGSSDLSSAVGIPPNINEDVLRPHLPISPAPPPPPPPPLPQQIHVDSINSQGQLLPPPLPPSFCGVGFQFTAVHSLSSQVMFSSPMQSSGTFQSSELVASNGSMSIPGLSQPNYLQPSLPSFAQRSWPDNNHLSIAAPPPPPPPPPPMYVDSEPGLHRNWGDTSPRIENSTSPHDYAGPPKIEERYSNEHVGFRHNLSNDLFGGDSRDFTERLKRKSLMQISPGDPRQDSFEPYHVPSIFVDRREEYQNPNPRMRDSSPIFLGNNPHNTTVRPAFDVNMPGRRSGEPAWSSELQGHRNVFPHEPRSPPLSPRGVGFRPGPPQHVPRDFQYQQRQSRLPPPSSFSSNRGLPQARYPRGHPTPF